MSKQIGSRKISGLIWIQSVCKNCQQMTLGGKKLRIDVTYSVKLNNIYKKYGWVIPAKICDVSTKSHCTAGIWLSVICLFCLSMRFANTFKNELMLQHVKTGIFPGLIWGRISAPSQFKNDQNLPEFLVLHFGEYFTKIQEKKQQSYKCMKICIKLWMKTFTFLCNFHEFLWGEIKAKALHC